MTSHDLAETILGFLLLAALLIGLPWLLAIWEALDQPPAPPASAVDLRVEQCGEAYRQSYEQALARIGRSNGFEIHHDPDCRLVVRKQKF